MVLDTAKLRTTGWRPKFTSAEAVAQAVRDSHKIVRRDA
jgi:nucleoside-diphosphate-sugar epimerase